MITTSDVNYPILLVGKHGKFGFRNNASDLVERTESLRHLNEVDWLQLLDREFNLYRMENLKPLRGAGRLGGYFFEGPFLSRKVVYQADLHLLKKLSVDEVAEIILKFMRSSQSFQKKDETMFRTTLAKVPSSELSTLEDMKRIYESLDWGD
jgi:hypothetical protein